MSKQANRTLIGAFVVGGIALAICAVAFLGSGKLFGRKINAVCYFTSSVQGLDAGSQVVFNGVRVGMVTRVVVLYDTENLSFQTPVYIEIDPSEIVTIGEHPLHAGDRLPALIKKGLRAELELQSFVTGQKQVSLLFLPDKPAVFVTKGKKIPEIPTVLSPLQESATAISKIPLDQIANRVVSILEGIEKVVNSPELASTMKSSSEAAAHISELSETVNERSKILIASVNGAVKDIQELANDLSELKDPTKKNLEALQVTLTEAATALRTVSAMLRADAPLPYQMTDTLDEVQRTARSLRAMADYLEQHPNSLIWGKAEQKGE